MGCQRKYLDGQGNLLQDGFYFFAPSKKKSPEIIAYVERNPHGKRVLTTLPYRVLGPLPGVCNNLIPLTEETYLQILS